MIVAEDLPTYEVRRSRRGTADIVVERDGRIIVRAPEWADDTLIARIVKDREYWIFKTLAEWRDLNRTQVSREYRNGEGFLYLGRTYRLTLDPELKQDLILKNGRFHLRRGLAAGVDSTSVREAFQGFYVQKGLDLIPKRVAYFAPKVGVAPLSVHVRDTGHWWGSCNTKGALAFHWKCMMAPRQILDYIVVHELCHLHHRDHTDAFWNEVDKVLPDYRERKEWLRRNGASLDN